MDDATLYEFDSDYIGRKSYVSVRGHSRSIPKYKCYKGRDGLNHVRPEYGGEPYDDVGGSAFILPDKAAYLSPMSRTVIEGRAAHREHMKVHGVVEAGDMKLGEYAGRDNSPMPRVGYDVKRAIEELRSR